MAATAHRLSGGRYALGLGRGFGALFEVMGLPKVTGGQLRDVVELYRRLWRGEAVLDHRGPAGTYPYLQQDSSFDENIPVMLAAIGDRTLELAGEIADGVVLHSFFADDTLARAVRVIRSAAEGAGRDPTSVRVWSVLVTVPEPMPQERVLRRLTGRLATYLQGYGDVLVRANGWDPEALRAFRGDPVVAGFPGAFDAVATAEQLAHLHELLPAEWLDAAAVGGPRRCAERIGDQFSAGADGVVLHAAEPAELPGVLDAWREVRAPAAFSSLPVNPGRSA
ncbi:TIGR03857 family LLM class F420-dependent oxidoreductase [Saccharopolyspora mangrovi]|uniref:TIGR03857 family LLM class F420-dependent oxidoreductase n=1 Tax=Saccharopolyspora mangrovi TaxID=3082379 RepID=A0ABU6ACQ8_9PSEU|nr:TIGR03857 family LLM class F420-dependent oxidoreductase [Saccharopolyspora sp. S2-29]MEB3369179.1 TIGR03857 family LLM class F420-dependent oxidoreductase [Saccharopolyspora sp. S2-29]